MTVAVPAVVRVSMAVMICIMVFWVIMTYIISGGAYSLHFPPYITMKFKFVLETSICVTTCSTSLEDEGSVEYKQILFYSIFRGRA